MVKFVDLKKKTPARKPKPKDAPADIIESGGDTRIDANEWYNLAGGFVASALEQAYNEEPIQISKGEQLVEQAVDACLTGILPKELFIQALQGEGFDSFLVTNAVNVTIYAIPIGAVLRMPRSDLLQLGLTALLHDIGKIRVTEELLYKETSLSQQELSVLRRYPYESFKIMRTLGMDYHFLAESALQVNERLDGSGYPQGLKGNDIHPYAQIIGLVDVYEAMTHKRPYRDKLLHFQAVKEMIKYQKGAFKHEHFKALLRTFTIFPLYSYVKLNSGAVGKVIETTEAQPLRPKVEIVLDAQGRPVPTPRIIDLAEQPVLHIVESVAAEIPAG
jgi:HD-GYP domain-containing protein (c-di-GMP phosphodiesterase class II)